MDRMETATTVELSVQEDFRRLDKCCFVAPLRYGLAVWLTIESLIWFILFIAAVYCEAVYIRTDDLLDFLDVTDETEQWYTYLLFGEKFYSIDHHVRTKIILFNFLLILIFLTYLAFCLTLAFGVFSYKICCFIPYCVFDAIFMFFAFIGCIVGLAVSNHLFRISFIFLLIKTYAEACVYSLFIEYLRRPKRAFSDAGSATIHQLGTSTV